jgi:hypothetical protein
MLRWELLDWSGIFPSSYLVLLTSSIFIIKYAHLEEMHRMETAISIPDAKLELWVWIGHFPSKYWGVSQYEYDSPVRWPWGEAAVEWCEAEKFVLSCYMYLVWICWDTYSCDIWKGYLDEIWEARKGRRIITTWLKCQIVCCSFWSPLLFLTLLAPLKLWILSRWHTNFFIYWSCPSCFRDVYASYIVETLRQ